MDKEMGWEGCKIEQLPVVVYGFDNRPKYYDFIVTDAEKQVAGTITVYARRTATTSIREVSSKIKDYRTSLSKASVSNSSLFEDWTGATYLGLRGKSGETPELVVNAETGELAEGIRELDGEEIITAIVNFDFENNFNSSILGISESDPMFTEIVEYLDQAGVMIDPAELQSRLYASLDNKTNQVTAFWNVITELLPEIESIEDDEEMFTIPGKGLLSLVKAVIQKVVVIFTGVDTSRYYIDKYTNYSGTFRLNKEPNECGPYACSYLVWIKNGRTGDTFDQFRSCASTVGEFGPLNLLGRLFEYLPNGGRPMSPAEMAWSLPVISGGRILMVDSWVMTDGAVYQHIKGAKKPAINLCVSNNQLHYRVAVGAKTTGNVLWQTYYFLQHDNNRLTSKGSNDAGEGKLRRDDDSYYKTVEFWNPWFLISD